jgi:serine/threonine protein kinase
MFSSSPEENKETALQFSTCSFVSSDFLNKSEKIRNIGAGTFGIVALYKTPIGSYIVKESKIQNRTLGYPSDFQTEVDTLIKFIPVASIVRLKGVCFDNNQKKGYIILEPLDSNLTQWARKTPFDERIKQLPQIISMIGAALAIMHHFSFVHNDVKTNNILVGRDENGNCIFKLADFGSAIHVTNPNVKYLGITEYLPPDVRDVYMSEFWAFMVCLIEVILGGERMVQSPNFYKPYLKVSRRGKLKFDLVRYLRSILTNAQLLQIPSDFWIFVDPILNGNQTSIAECLSRIGINLNTKVIEDIDRGISREVPMNPRFSLVEEEFRKRLDNVGLITYFNKFRRLFNKFLSTTSGNLDDIDIKHYAEVAFVTVARSRADNFVYFKDVRMFLAFQRAFLICLGYQTVILEKTS